MSTRGRGRKKAVAKTPARHLQPAPQELIDGREALHAADLALARQPAPPPSPIIALAKQAMSPVLAVAKAAAMAAACTAATAAAALPSIPEVSVLASHSLDITQGQDSDEPPCSTPKSSRAAAADDGHDNDDLCASDKGMPLPPHQQQQPVSADVLLNRHSLQAPDNCGSAQAAAATAAADNDDSNGNPAAAGFAARCVKLMQHLRGGSAAVPAAPALLACMLLFCIMLAVLGMGLRVHQANRATIALQQQQVAAQAATLAALQQQLQQLPSLQDSASSCRSGLQQLATLQQQLNSSVAQLAGTAQQLAANVTSVETRLQQERQAWQLLSADGGAPSPSGSADAAAEAQDSAAQQQVPLTAAEAPQEQQHAARRRELLQREVQKQLGAALPPLNVAAEGCGARVVFHTALAAPRQQASLQASPQVTLAPAATSSVRWLAPRVQQLLLAHVLPASLAGERGQARRAQQQHVPQAQLLPRAGALSGVLLRPSGAQRCVPLQLAPAAVVEIQLPQPARIASITLHHPPAPAAAAAGQGSDAAVAAWAAATPAELTIAAVNSSTCGLGSAGPCSRAGMLLAQTSSGQLDAGGAGSGDSPSHAAGHGGAAVLLADGVQATEQQVVLQPDSFAAGLTRVALLGSSQQVVADRLVLLVSQNMLERHAAATAGGGGEVDGRGSVEHATVICLHRISVQGTPLEPASFC